MKKAATLIVVIMLAVMTAASMAGCTGSGSSHEAHDKNEAGQGEASSADSSDIGYERVKAIVLSKVAGASESDIYGLECEYDDGGLEYEGSLYYNGYEYEFEIDGTTGNILKWEIDEDD